MPRNQSMTGSYPRPPHSLQALLEALRNERVYSAEGALDEEWDNRFDLMLAYGQIHGTYNIPWGLICELPNGGDVRLGYWLHEQRQNMKKMKLRPDRQRRLQDLVDRGKLYWVMDGARARSLVVTDDSGWDMQYELMLKYGEEHEGNCNVPWGYTCKGPDGTDVRLGFWVKAQRSNRKSGKLRPDRLERLMRLVDAGKLRWSKKAAQEVTAAPTDEGALAMHPPMPSHALMTSAPSLPNMPSHMTQISLENMASAMETAPELLHMQRHEEMLQAMLNDHRNLEAAEV